MERIPEDPQPSRKHAFLGGVASIGAGLAAVGEGLAHVFGGHVDVDRAINRTRRYYTVEEDPDGYREDATAMNQDWRMFERRRDT